MFRRLATKIFAWAMFLPARTKSLLCSPKTKAYFLPKPALLAISDKFFSSCFVLFVESRLSTTINLLLWNLSERTVKRDLRNALRFIFRDQSRSFRGPIVTPPWRHSGDRTEP